MKNKKHIEKISELPCVLCGELGMVQEGRTYVHHIREGQGMSQRASDYLMIPLCYECHQGKEGIHGDKALLKIARMNELDMLAIVIKRISQ